MDPVETALIAAAGGIVSKHTRHTKGASEAACAAIKAGVEISVDVASVAISATGGTVFFRNVADAGTKAALNTVVPATLSLGFRTGAKMAKTGGEAADQLLRSHMNEDTDADGDLHMQQATLTGLCSIVDGDMKNEDFERFAQMTHHIAEAFAEMRTGLEEMFTEVMRNNDTSLEVSPLAMALSSVNYQKTVKSFTMGTAKFEE